MEKLGPDELRERDAEQVSQLSGMYQCLTQGASHE